MNLLTIATRKARTAATLMKEGGWRSVTEELLRKVGPTPPGPGIQTLVKWQDAEAVDWTVPHPSLAHPHRVPEGPIHFAWIMSPPGRSGGGHHNIFRFISYLEQAGHTVSIHLYWHNDHAVSVPHIRDMLAETPAYAKVNAPIWLYDGAAGVGPNVDAIVATGWETAYPAFLDRSAAQRFYFVQDFEPDFYPTGTESVLAENTYHFGFHGITAGAWLQDRLRRDYGMNCDRFDFSADKQTYFVTNDAPRKEIFFYARPVTPRRAFELGVLALEEFAKLRPDVTINLAGWDVSGYDLGFEFVDHADMDLDDLNELYNRCAAGLVLSLTNMSLLPLELMAAGVTPVVNDGANNTMVSANPNIRYVPLAPKALARALSEVVDEHAEQSPARRIADSLVDKDWSASGRQMVQAMERVMRG